MEDLKDIIRILFFFLVTVNVFAQMESFDIATFTPPVGWQRSVTNGVLTFQDYRDNAGQVSFCQISLFPSYETGEAPIKNFESEWQERVVKVTGTKAAPQTQTENSPDGWTVVTGSAEVSYQGISYACLLLTMTRSGKSMSILVNLAGPEHAAHVQSFLTSIALDNKMPSSKPRSEKSSASQTYNFDNYSFMVPDKWFAYRTSEYVMLKQAPNDEPGCSITILPPQPSSGDLESDTRNIFNQMYSGWQFREAGRKQFDLLKGYTLQGLEYCVMEAPMHKLSADGSRYEGFEDGGALVIKFDIKIVVIAVRHTSMLAHTDCINKYETWRRFFNSFTIKGAIPPKRSDGNISDRIVGVWKLSAHGPAQGKYVFAANGNYQFEGGIGSSSVTRDDRYEYLHLKSYAFEGDGSYSIQGNKLSLYKRNEPDPAYVQFRFEMVNHGNTGWKDRLYILKTNPPPIGTYEVCYEKADER